MDLKAQQWIREFGPAKIADAFPAELRVTVDAVYHWLAGRRKPCFERADYLQGLAKADRKHGGNRLRLTVRSFRAPHEVPPEPPQTNNEAITQ